jgi:hypothetical protein
MGLPPRTFSLHLFAAVAIASLALVGCTGDEPPTGDGTGPPEGSPSTSPPPVTSADSYVFTDAAGIEVRLTLEGTDAASLTVENDTGATLPPPGVYVLDARDGTRVDWTVLETGAAPKGESAWQVQRPPVPEAKHIGLVVMLFGGEDYGAFVPPRPGGAA